MDDIYAIDKIQAWGAKLIWITPKMREQWQHKEFALIPRLPTKLNVTAD